MDTGRLKRFATEARKILMQGVKNRLQSLGFDLKTGQAQELPQEMEGGAVFMNDVVSTDFYRKWMSLYQNVLARSIREVAEEAAYTWFNRFMAIRIMEKRGFIAPVLEFESDDIHIPAIVNEATQGRMPQMTEVVRSQLMELLDDPSKVSEQFALLIVAYCHDNPIINKCFGAIADYTELLLPVNILSDGGFIDMVNETEFITEEQYASAELIGWLYQFYISDRKDEAFAKKGKYDPDEIAPATQIFTPNWIVKYMVQNTIGRIYLDNNPYEEDVQKNWKYLVNNQELENLRINGEGKFSNSPILDKLVVNDLKDFKFADLACGSGHILNEAFDLLYDLYVNEGYSRTDAIKNIFRYNLVGVDIDTRAKQLATFALLMKACGKDKSFLNAKVMPRVYSMPRPINEVLPNYEEVLPQFLMGDNQKMVEELKDALKLMNHADTLGSIMKFNLSDAARNTVMVRVQEYEEQLAHGEIVTEESRLLLPYMRIILALTDKYAAICMNPPYMGSGRFDTTLSKYVKDNYPKSKADLFAVFMDVAIDRLADCGKYGMINMHSWMFLSSFEQLRKSLLDNYHIDSLLHLGTRTFDELSGEVVQNAAFVVTNCSSRIRELENYGIYFRLVDGRNCGDKERMFLDAQANHTEKVYYPNVEQKNFEKIPEARMGYWISDKLMERWEYGLFDDNQIIIRQGLASGDNDTFIRNWFEISDNRFNVKATSCKSALDSGYKWFPFHKGGEARSWYGNSGNVISFNQKSYDILINQGNHLPSKEYYFKEGVLFSRISSKRLNAKYTPAGFVFDGSAPLGIANGRLYEKLGFMCSKAITAFLEVLAPTLTFQVGDVRKSAYIDISNETIEELVKDNIFISRADWDSHETSWDFESNPLVALCNEMRSRIDEEDSEKRQFSNSPILDKKSLLLEDLVEEFETQWTERFMQLHENEEELNRQFISIYGLEDELTPDVPLDEITILQQGEITIADD